MNRQTFLDSFGPVADAPGGIENLRRLVLELAFQGRLSAPEPDDRPAALSIEEATQSREVWTEPSAPAKYSRKDSGHPFGQSALPPTWACSRLGEVMQLVNGRAYKKAEWRLEGTPVIRIQNLNGGDDYYFSDLELKAHNYCHDGDLLFAWSASFGPYIWLGEKAIFHYHIWKVVTSPALIRRFGYYLLEAMTAAVKSASHGLAMLHMTKETMEGLNCPIPPVAEQRRIVERIDELMALCEELEQQRAARTEARSVLTAATLHRVVEADDAAALESAVVRFAERLDLHLSPGEGDIGALNQLRQAILDLAVHGRLTSRDSGDEPANVVVARILSDRTERGSSSRSRRSDSRPSLPLMPQPFELPESWTWARLGEISRSRLGKMLDEQKNTGHPRPYLRNTNVQWGRFKLDDIKHIRIEDEDLAEYTLQDGDLLVVEGGEPGRCAIWDSGLVDGVMVFQKALHRVRPEGGVSARYLAIVLRNGIDSGRLRELFTGSTIKHLTGEKIKSFPVPLPPVAEQHRIVERVEELLAFCDDLEQQFVSAEALRGDLAASITAHAIVDVA